VVEFLYQEAESYIREKESRPAIEPASSRFMYKKTYCARTWLPVALLQSRVSDQGQDKSKKKKFRMNNSFKKVIKM
jgi:hypothetical protein